MSGLIEYETSPKYVIYLEPVGEKLFVHIEVFDWSADTFRLLKRKLDQFQHPLYAAVWNDKLEKFTKMFGFAYTGHSINMQNRQSGNVRNAKLYVREV